MSDRETDAKIFRDNPTAIAGYLSEAFAKNDIDVVLKALNRVMRAQNVSALAREAKLRRDKLYSTFGGNSQPYLYRVMALLNAMGVRLTVMPMPPRPIPPRPKPGRPRKVISNGTPAPKSKG